MKICTRALQVHVPVGLLININPYMYVYMYIYMYSRFRPIHLPLPGFKQEKIHLQCKLHWFWRTSNCGSQIQVATG